MPPRSGRPSKVLRLIYGLEDGRRWPISQGIRAADAGEWDVRRAKQKIDSHLVAWQMSEQPSGSDWA